MIPGPFVLVGALRTAERRSLSSAGHLTGAAGRWSATHPWTAILAWLGCVVVLLLAGHLAGTIQFQLTGNIVDDATSVVPVQAAAAAHPQIQIAETGDGTINKAVNDTIFRDLRRGCPDLVALSIEERVGHGPADEDPVGHADQNAERVELVPDLRPAGHHHVRPPDVSDQPAERAATVVSARPPSSRNERSS
jgi:hypothetical protein